MSLLPLAEALERLLDGVTAVVETQSVPLSLLGGRVAAEDVRAQRTQPGFDASAMDGYAVRCGDLIGDSTVLTVIGESSAGQAFDGAVATGEAVRIFTGAPMPKGADAVVIQENMERLPGGKVRAFQTVERGQHIRPAGNDFRQGDTLISVGTTLTAGSIALAASAGYPSLRVLRRPRVAILATGNELVPPGETLGPSDIIASNGYGIAEIVERSGGDVLDLGIAKDEVEAIGAKLDRAIAEGCDIVVTLGGASVGDHDLVAPALRSRGVDLDFWKIAMRPGKPLMAGRRGNIHFLGLPGNPASSLVGGEVFLRPLIRRLAGFGRDERFLDGYLGCDVKPNDHRAEFMRATLTSDDHGRVLVQPLERQDSSLLTVYARATALLFRQANAPAALAGEKCRYLLLS